VSDPQADGRFVFVGWQGVAAAPPHIPVVMPDASRVGKFQLKHRQNFLKLFLR
jgi:hypothetical protein